MNRYSNGHTTTTTPDTKGNPITNALRSFKYKVLNDWEYSGELARRNDEALTAVRAAHLANMK